jgi:uncharacterized protein YcfJ
MNRILQTALAAGLAIAGSAAAEVTFYEHEGFAGRNFTARDEVRDLTRYGYSDRASSVVVADDRWEVCDDVRFGGRCIVLRPGRYPSLAAMGLNDRISSMRTVDRQARIDDSRYAPAYASGSRDSRDYRRRGDERLYDAEVTSVRAIVGQSGQRCWVERDRMSDRGDPSIPGAVAGAVIGGILGHQVGSGRGNDAATVGGALVGGVVGANVGRSGGEQYPRDVRRCDSAPTQSRADYWDVTYNFRGQDHHVQMSAPPGRTISVNGEGEPRG